MSSIVFVGRLTYNNSPCAGEVRKNQLLLERLSEIPNIHVLSVNTSHSDGKKRLIFKFIEILCKSKFGFNKIILSTHDRSAYFLLYLFSKMPIRFNIIYWVIGGGLHKYIKENKLDISRYRIPYYTIVEDDDIRKKLENEGIKNVITATNFKPVHTIDKQCNSNTIKRFVFASRVTALKGCDIMIAATRILNSRNKKFAVDVYGPVETGYPFEEYVTNVPNITYRGFMNLVTCEDYQELSKYDVQLFPTYYYNEGFPGTIIDAYMAGLPIITTDWRYNSHFVDNGETGWLIPTQDALTLANLMEEIIDNKIDLKYMSQKCIEKAKEYDVSKVVDDQLLKTINIID